ncbi:MAG: ROK family protein [Kiritimatiellia bacterium]
MHPEHSSALPRPVLLTADIGGTWIKLAAFDPDGDSPLARTRIPNPSREGRPGAFPDEVRTALRKLLDGRAAAGIGISTAGIVDYGGTRLVAGHAFLDPLKSPGFRDALRAEFGCPVTLINDGDAALIGAARAGYFTGPGCHGLLVVGTGCGFAIWKNGLRWRPDRQLPLLGALRTPDGTFDELCSASALAARTAGNNLERVFVRADCRPLLDEYLGRLARLVENAALTYHCESILLAGGLVAAAREAGCDLAAALGARLTPSTDYYRAPIVRCAREGNDLALAGVRALISAESAIARHHVRPDFRRLPTEAPAERPLRLETRPAEELIGLCLDNENRVAANWNRQAGAMAECARRLSAALRDGGRLIYLGCGTSGRLAALDALELSCTPGCPEQAVALISGGVAEAAPASRRTSRRTPARCPSCCSRGPVRAMW